MALTRCADCGKEISDKAGACPHCGCPLASLPDIVAGRQVQTIERTSKKYKGRMLLCCGIAVLALCVAISDNGIIVGEVAAFVLSVAIIFLIVTIIQAWWHHG